MHQTSIRHAGDLRSRDRVRDRQPFTIVGTATLVTVLVCGASVLVRGAELTELERQRLVAHLEMTGNWLLDEVSNLSERQLEFRRAPDSWNIKEVLEHLIVVGPIYWNDLQKAVKGPATDRQPSPSGGDAGILWYGIDRTHRETAIPPERPKGELRDVARGLETYRQQHARLLQYVKTTKDDLRARWVDRQACDAYQWALLISTHEQRHVLQIRDIKKQPQYPKR